MRQSLIKHLARRIDNNFPIAPHPLSDFVVDALVEWLRDNADGIVADSWLFTDEDGQPKFYASGDGPTAFAVPHALADLLEEQQ